MDKPTKSVGKNVMREFASLLPSGCDDLDADQRSDIYRTLSLALADDERHEQCLYRAALNVDAQA